MDDRTDNPIRPGGEPLGPHLTSEQQSAYLDGDLTVAERARLSTHLDSCPSCSEELSQLRATRTLLQSLPTYRAKRSFQLSPEQARVALRWWERLGFSLLPALPTLRGATVAAALLLVVVTGGDILWDRSSTTDTTNTEIVEATVPPANTVASTHLPAATQTTAITVTPMPTLAKAPEIPTVAPTAADGAAQPPPGDAASGETSGSAGGAAAPTETPDGSAERSGLVANPTATSDLEEESDASAGDVDDSSLGSSNADAAAPAPEETAPAPEQGDASSSDAAASSNQAPQSSTDSGANTDTGDESNEGFTMAAAPEGSPSDDGEINQSVGATPTLASTLSATATATRTPTVTPSATATTSATSTAVASPEATTTVMSPTPTAESRAITSPSSNDGSSGWRTAQGVLSGILAVLLITLIALTVFRRRKSIL